MGDCSAQIILLPPKGLETALLRTDLEGASLLWWHMPVQEGDGFSLLALQRGTSLVSFISISLTID